MDTALIPVLVVVLVLVVGGVALAVAPGPRRSRAYRRASKWLAQGEWTQALTLIRSVLDSGPHPPAWEKKLRTLEGQCRQAGGEATLAEGRYEESHQHFQQAAALLGLDAGSLRDRVVEALLARVRSEFSAGHDIHELLERALKLQPTSAEILFWQGLCASREGAIEEAVALLDQAHQFGNRQHIDPPLYLGVLLHRQGKPQEALRILGEANRVDANCPLVAWQLGLSMIAAGGDSGLAIRALQKAIGPKGLTLWVPWPNRAWVEAFPSGRSFVRKLAEKHAFTCPVFGGDLRVLIRQAELALGQALYREDRFQESAEVFQKLLEEAPPTLGVLRGLGLALVRLGRYDQAFKHLRAALEMEPGHALTAGYLALCGARGKPQQPEDRAKNVAWAVRQAARFDGTGNTEYAALMSAIHAEARALGLPLGREEQAGLCQVLVSVKAHDPDAARAYMHQASTFPDDVRDEGAWLFARAVGLHGVGGEGELTLLARVFRERESARAYFRRQGWDFEEIEFLFLERWAAYQPGGFPAFLGRDYPARGESLLLERSSWLEGMEDLDGAHRSVEILLRLAPHSGAANDRLACLQYRRGERLQAIATLEAWQKFAPADPMPVVRRAVIEQQMGQLEPCLASLERALTLTQGSLRASVAFLGARLMLAQWLGENHNPLALDRAERFLHRCLHEQQDHPDALWLLAALRAMRGDAAGLTALAPVIRRVDHAEPRLQLMASICLLLAGQAEEAIAAAHKASSSAELGQEAQFVLAWAHLRQGDEASALQALQPVAAGKGPSTELARAMLGRLNLQRGAYADAIKWLSATDAARRADWKLDEPLRQSVLLAGLAAFRTGQFELAAERFREAGKLGLRERRLGPLIALSLFKAGQRTLFQS